MIELERILVPTDFSEASGHSLPHAFELARRFGAQLTMTHIQVPLSPEHDFSDEGKYEDYIKSELLETSKAGGPGLSVETVLKRNISVASGILEAITENNINMVVMGTHGRSALVEFFLGSVAEKVVRHSPVPVLTVAPDRPGYRKDPIYRNILATFDFSRHSSGAVKGAWELADKYKAKLQVLYVIEQEVHPGYHETWKEMVNRDIPAIETDARKALARVLGEKALDETEVCVVVGTGDGKVYSEISRFAGEQESDLLVMGTHGLSGFEHILLGSTTERVVRTAPCPVLTFHLGPSEEGTE